MATNQGRESEREGVEQFLARFGDKGFETVKHLTTLSAGSTVLIATFLQDIFPKDESGVLAVGLLSKFLIAGAFLSFGISLLASSFFMYMYTMGDVIFPVFPRSWLEPIRLYEVRFKPFQLESRKHSDEDRAHPLDAAEMSEGAGDRIETEVEQRRVRRFFTLARWGFFLPFGTFIFGISCFGVAVLINVL